MSAPDTGHDYDGIRELESPAERRAVHRHDQRHRQVFEALQHGVHLRQPGRAAPCHLFEALDVGAGDKRPSGANHDCSRDGGVAGDFIDRRR